MSLEKISELIKAARLESPEYDTFVKDDPISAFLSLEAANKATPLDIDRMIANPSAALHDLYGIGRHMNPETKKFDNCFHPRFAKSLTVTVEVKKKVITQASASINIDPEEVWKTLGYSTEDVIEHDMDVMDYVVDYLQELDEDNPPSGLDLQDLKSQMEEDFQYEMEELCWHHIDWKVKK
tara:strand:+ start:147 stop:689 length:543 start_codon:yes stop_codon:yes gene_type:complete